MPMFFVRIEPDYIAGPDFLNRAALPLGPAATRGDDQSLA